MKTVSINVSTLCVPCANRCRYCLLSWDGKLLGLDYETARDYAEGFYHWLRVNRPELSFQFYFGYSMDHPQITETIDFARKIGSVGGEFLQLDGLTFREPEELRQWLQEIQAHGIRSIDLTFYGTEAYHDRFAGRQGDFLYMQEILAQATNLGIAVTVSIPITSENADQMEALLDCFEGKVQNLRIFVPHREGRGVHLEKIRLTKDRLDSLSPRVLGYFNCSRYKSEGQWVREQNFQIPENRMLCLVLTPENFPHFESIGYEAAIRELEAMDDAFYARIPPLEVLAREYGDPAGEKIFDQRDLYLYYQSKYIRDRKLSIYDINEERHCFSRRF